MRFAPSDESDRLCAPLRSDFQAMKRVVARNMSSYPAYVVNAPVAEVSKAANGVRVATEVTQ